MKKLILGLLLTVGTTGFALANTIKVDNQNSVSDVMEAKSEIISKTSDQVIVVACTHRYYLRVMDCNGGFEDINLGTYEGSCGSSGDGTMFMHKMTEEPYC